MIARLYRMIPLVIVLAVAALVIYLVVSWRQRGAHHRVHVAHARAFRGVSACEPLFAHRREPVCLRHRGELPRCRARRACHRAHLPCRLREEPSSVRKARPEGHEEAPPTVAGELRSSRVLVNGFWSRIRVCCGFWSESGVCCVSSSMRGGVSPSRWFSSRTKPRFVTMASGRSLWELHASYPYSHRTRTRPCTRSRRFAVNGRLHLLQSRQL